MDFPNKAKVPPLLRPYVEAWGNQDAEALDNVQDGKAIPFGRVTLSRR